MGGNFKSGKKGAFTEIGKIKSFHNIGTCCGRGGKLQAPLSLGKEIFCNLE